MTMKYMAKPAYSESGSLIDGGIDLNMEAGFAEYDISKRENFQTFIVLIF